MEYPQADASEIAATVSRVAIKDAHREMIEHLREKGFTYDQIARVFGIKDGSALRQYSNRKTSFVRRTGLASNQPSVLEQMHAGIIGHFTELEAVLPVHLLRNYNVITQLSAESSSKEPTWSIAPDALRPGEKYRSFSDTYQETTQLFDTAHNVFDLSTGDTIDRTDYIAGKYYMYRASSANDREGSQNVIIKSFVTIKCGKRLRSGRRPSLVCRFTIQHPDREYDPAVRGDTPITTHGIIMYHSGEYWLFGNTEGGQGVKVIALREPLKPDFNLLVGFATTTNADRVLINGRVVLIREPQAGVSGIRRLREKDFDFNAEKFSLELLAGPPTLFDKSSRIRRLPAQC